MHAAERLGVAEADLRKKNPGLVYASITGYGDDGPYADRRGYDPIFQSLTGYVAAQINPEIPVPDLVRNSLVDKATSFALAQGITAALLARERGARHQAAAGGKSASCARGDTSGGPCRVRARSPDH